MPNTLTQTAFGKARRLSQGRVSQLISEGMPIAADGRIDPVSADAWLAWNVDPARREAAAHGRTAQTGKLAGVADARREKIGIDTRLAALELKKREGSLISRDMVEKWVFERARTERDALITWVARIAPVMAHDLDVDPQRAFAFLDQAVREHLLELSQAKPEAL